MTTTSVPPLYGRLFDCVRTATAAPSVHNSQPWRFAVRAGTVDVYADPGRRLPVLDPAGREYLMSVGAAVFTLRLAIRRAGYLSQLLLFPEPEEPELVARVTVTHPSVVTPAVEALAAAIPHRHTNRRPLAPAPVPPAVLDQLRDAARLEGAVLAAANPAGRTAITALTASADRWLRARPGYPQELARWTAGGPSARLDPNATVLVLATRGDRWPDWVLAGQALQRVLLTATSRDLVAVPASQPVEVPAVRRRLLDPAAGLSVQLVLGVGYGRPASRTPRRPLAEVLLGGTTGGARPAPAGAPVFS